MRVLAMSSSYGTGGSIIAPALSERLDIPLLRRISIEHRDDEGMDDVISEGPIAGEDLTRNLWERILDAFASMPVEHGMVPTSVPADTSLRVKSEVEERIRSFAAEPAGGLVWGWASSMVLPEAFHVLLDGPVEARIRQAASIESVDIATARTRLEKSGAIRRVYWKRLYNRDWLDKNSFHMCLDTTAISAEFAVDIIATAAEAFWSQHG